MNSSRSRRAGQRLGRLAIGLVLVGAGLFVLANASMIATLISAYISPPPDPTAGIAGSGYTEGYLPFLVWGFGFTLIGSGGAVLRRAFMSPMGGGFGGRGMDPTDMVNAYMSQAMSSVPKTGAKPTQAAPMEVVRIKCRNCGSLEAEDAAFCRKCGEPL